MDIITKLKGLTYLGMGTIAGSVVYATRRAKIERRFRSRTTRKSFTIGSFQKETEIGSGMVFDFENASLEVMFVMPGVPRMTWTPGELPLNYVVARAEFNPVPVRVGRDKDGFTIESNGIAVIVSRSGTVTFKNVAGTVLRQDEAPVMTSAGWKVRAAMKDDESYFGLGMKSSGMNLRGNSYKLWNLEAKGAYGPKSDPLYVSCPTYLTVSPRGSHVVFFDNTFRSHFSFKDSMEAVFEGGAVRYFLFSGTAEEAVGRYYDLIGHPVMPPRWALGYHQCRWSYMNEGEVREVAEGFKKHGLPVSAIHMDIHYMDGHRVFTVDPAKFPQLKKMCDDLMQDGIRMVTILDPGVKMDPEYFLYKEGCEIDAFLRLPDGTHAESLVWPGWCAFPDYSDPKVREWWAGQYKILIDQGISGFWHDMNEPAAFAAWGDCTLPTATIHKMEGRGGTHLEAHNLYGLHEAMAGFEGQKMFKPERRPWILSRSGWPGLARYAWHWTGDCESNWWSLAQTLRIVMNLSMSGIPYSGADIGGFGGYPDKELYIRWFEASALLPFFRVHSAFFTPRREPWCFDEETLEITRFHLKRRYSMLSYWYTLAAAATRTGRTPVRPMYLEDVSMVGIDDQFMVGTALLAAPIVEKGSRSRTVRLPGGVWYDWETGEPKNGSFDVEVPLGAMPIYGRAGSIVPVDVENGVELRVFMPTTEGQGVGGELYRDAGDGYGSSLLEQFSLTFNGSAVTVTRKATGDFKPESDGFAIRTIGSAPDRIIVDGKPVSATQDTFVVPSGFTTIEIPA